jgi:hypothetical protein
MSRVLFVVLTVCLMSTVVLGADKRDGDEWRLFVGSASPTGDFVKNDENSINAGHAALGYCIGVDLCLPSDAKGIGFIYSIIYSKNDENDFAIHNIRPFSSEYEETNYSTNSHTNVSALMGVKYQTQFQGKTSLFVTGQVGLNFLNAGNIEFDYGSSTEYLAQYNWSTSFGYAIGGGITFDRQLSLQLRYLSFEEHVVRGNYTQNVSWTNDPNAKKLKRVMSVSTLMLTLQFHVPW